MSDAKVLRSRLSLVANRDDGQSLVLAILLLLVLSIATTATVTIVTSSQSSSTRDRQGALALTAGEAGLDLGANTVSGTGGNPPSGVQTTTIDGAQVQWQATQLSTSATGSVWKVDVRSTSGKTTKVLSEQLTSTVHPGTPGAPSPVYSVGLFTGDSSPAGDCSTDLSSTAYGNWVTNGGSGPGSAQIMSSVWLNNSLCISGGSKPVIGNDSTDPTHPVSIYVQGNYYAKTNTHPVGTTTDRIASSTIAGHCWVRSGYANQVYCDGDKPVAQGGDPTRTPVSRPNYGPGIYANAYSSQPAARTKPIIWETGAYAGSSPGPVTGCGTGHGQVPGGLKFESTGSTVANASVPTQRLLLVTGSAGTSSFDCRTYDGSGNLIGQLTWVYGQPGTLTVNGQVFIDGNLTFTGNDKAAYDGQGVIYVDGTVNFDSGARLCANTATYTYTGGDCTTTWNPSATDPVLEIVALNHSNLVTDDTAKTSTAVNPNVDGFKMVGDAQFQGIAFVSGRFDFPSGSAFPVGGVISDTAVIAGGATFGHIPAPPPNAPGSTSTPASVTTWALSQSSWRQCPSSASTFCP